MSRGLSGSLDRGTTCMSSMFCRLHLWGSIGVIRPCGMSPPHLLSFASVSSCWRGVRLDVMVGRAQLVI